jgi:Protein of unknown function (DUF1573)/Abnormal spindle-like microcephaly-assoc'd, ASPM-SPD-2-Hydin
MKFLPRMVLALFVSIWPLSFAVAQQLQCSPSSHDYGQVQVGTTAQYVFQLKNTGTSSLTISSKHKTSTDFSFSKFSLPLTLQPGQTSQMKVNFSPSAAGGVSASITLQSNARNPALNVAVSGTGVSANRATLGVAPSSLNFGNVTVGSSAKLTLTLSAANGSVTLSSAQVNSSEFTLSGLTFPKTIAAGQNVSATVTFIPNASGTASASLTIISDAANSPTAVSLTGTGVAVKSHSADLNWNASHDVVIGYNVYRGGKTGGPYAKLNSVLNATTNYTDSTVGAGATYYYVVTAVDSSYAESINSNEAKITIPTP